MVFLISCAVLAQDELPDSEATYPHMLEFIAGEVISVSSGEIVLKDYDYDKDKEVKVSFLINDDTAIEGVESVDAINKGHLAEIEYMVTGGTRTAYTIYVDKSELPDDLDEIPAIEEDVLPVFLK